jgi:RNA polymerase sigma factor (sigma-70 family)
MEVSAVTYSGGIGLQARSSLLRLQSDERLISLTRRGSAAAFEALVSRYQVRLLAFCRHLLVSREDAEDVLQEVFAAAFNAILADDRPIAARPWLYRIARNRCLNHLRRVQPLSVDSMDLHLSEHGTSAADKVHARENFRLLVGDIHGLPETQRSALVLREMAALSYEQIAQAMETTVPSVKSLLVRARLSLAEAAEARQLGCSDVRHELAEVAEGLSRRPGPLVRRHLRTCARCSSFEQQLKRTNKALAAYLPIGSLALLRKLALFHLGHSAGTGSGAGGTAGVSGAAGAGGTAGVGGATATGTAGVSGMAASATGTAGITGATAGATGISSVAAGAGSSLLSAGAGALATKAAATLAVAAIATAGAVATTHNQNRHATAPPIPTIQKSSSPATSTSSQTTTQPTANPAPAAVAPPSTQPTATTPTTATATTTTTTATTTTATTTTPTTTVATQSTTTTTPTTPATTASDPSSSGTGSQSSGTDSGSGGTDPGSGNGGTSGGGSTGGSGTTGSGSGTTGTGATGGTNAAFDSGSGATGTVSPQAAAS